ncbi:HvfX family Cu-binding RiPP maturation protein [Zhongshania aliphaticivorans]|uniref:HvfX family Cu-binding RiPP maturation protein n=1 Tax=Zhongshania aliphaticivorans TaxID=1470434 RepID=UPI0012E6E006|nr:DoxX family protein [Zhongshania aliphaticivorans]CAA0115373.1 Putative oxidoreductase CatD [Zhongshania aliphaticivorans]
MVDFFNKIRGIQNALGRLAEPIDGLPSLALRLYLVPVFWMAGSSKVMHFSDTVEWFGNSDWGLGLPFPYLMAFMATAAELGGAVLLLLGLATRWISIPLAVTMIVAATTVHWHNGWQAIADASAPFANERVVDSVEKLSAARSLLEAHGNYDWLSSSGNFVVLNNGIEFAVTYLIMLLALVMMGGGRFVSADYWLNRALAKAK